MASPIVHAFLPALAIRLFTKDVRYLLLAVIAGAMPDIDGVFLLVSTDLYYAFHHEILHPLIMGVCFGLLAALLLRKFFKMNFVKSLAVFVFAYWLHALTDVFFSDWYVRLFWPFFIEKSSFPLTGDHSLLLMINIVFSLAVLFAVVYVFRKEIRQAYFYLKQSVLKSKQKKMVK
jgi:membrane-bound metal-dependent hydrolase YbcI (DUF457 family)